MSAPNMAANFQQQMGGPGQMMAQQQQQQQQRPPPGSNPSGQIQLLIYNTLSAQTGPLSGWQAQVLINERMSLIFNVSVIPNYMPGKSSLFNIWLYLRN